MVLFTILMIALILIAIGVALTVGIGGALVIVMLGDIIVCAAIIACIIKFFVKRRRK